MAAVHPGGFEVEFWFDTSDSMWHAQVGTFQFPGSTLEDALKQAQAFLQSVFGPNYCFSVAIDSKV